MLRIAVLLAIVALCNAINWDGTWTANNRFGGVMYTCARGDRLYGVYSNGGMIIGRINGNNVKGNWYEGGRGDRHHYQGSFDITLSADGNEFDGLYNRVSEEGRPHRWKESRKGAPFPTNPTSEQCLVPVRQRVLGTFFGGPEQDNTPGEYKICRDQFGQVYGSFQSPRGFLEGWSFDDATGFHGYRYTNDGRSGAYILRSTGDNEVRGFFWRGRLAPENIRTSRAVHLQRSSLTAKKKDCEKIGPGFLRRLRGPSSASTITYSFVVIVASVMMAFLYL